MKKGYSVYMMLFQKFVLSLRRILMQYNDGNGDNQNEFGECDPPHGGNNSSQKKHVRHGRHYSASG